MATNYTTGASAPTNLPPSTTIKSLLTFGFAGGLSALSLGIAVQYGMSIGSATGTATAILLIALGVLTEIGKGLGFYSAAANLKSRSYLPVAGWLVVALCCLSYSVTADLHVSATSRGDATAKRGQSIQTLKDARFDRETASLSLHSIESQASFTQRIGKLLATPKSNGCVKVDGPVSRSVCSSLAALKAEKVAAAKRTTALEAKIAKANTVIASGSSHVTGAADASADTLSKVLAKFGFDVQASDVTLVLVFLPVLIIEFCGSLAWLLAGSIQVARAHVNTGGQVIDGDLAETSKTSVPSVTGHVDRGDDEPGSGAEPPPLKWSDSKYGY
jgi:hypothetical protein